jgi:cyclophilin family peptidyl-prolyl cis-trans isomerase/HEAT repeat protein
MKDTSASTCAGPMAVLAALVVSACASAPVAAPVAPTVPFEKKMAWMLQLEDRRILRLESPAPAPVLPPVVQRRGRPAPPPAPPIVTPDLTTLVTDTEPRVRRRAALAIGRVGLTEGIAPLTAVLGDADPEVREMAAFGLGLIGDAAATPALVAALGDSSPIVRGRAAEALGQIGAKEAAEPIGRMAAELARSSAVTAMQPDDETWPAAPEAEAFRLGVFALVRLGAYEPLAAAVLDAGGHPVSTWWPVAFALGRVADARAQPALLELLSTRGKYSAAFAARGLGVTKAQAAVAPLVALLGSAQTPLEVVVSAERALALVGDSRAGGPLIALASEPTVDPNVRLEAVTALGTLRAADALPVVQDLLTDPWPAMRMAALRAAVAIDPESFLIVLSSMDPDNQWIVRAALAEVLGSLPAGTVMERVRGMLQDQDRRVVPAVLRSLARLKAPDLAAVALDQLKEPDFGVRAEAAQLVGELKPAGGPDALREALALAQADAAIDARAAILKALAQYGPAEATPALKAALADKDWAVRLHAVQLLRTLDPAASADRAAIRPAPGEPIAPYDDPQLIAPALSPHIFIETARGTIEFELAVLDAPQTAASFIALARKGFFNGVPIHRVVPNFVVQMGDPRGDGAGSAGYTIRDELNERPFVRGSVGMALSGKDTGGSQFFITHSPQPHLDARYTAFGHVVNGMDVLDRIQQGDVIQRVRVWDGKTMQ